MDIKPDLIALCLKHDRRAEYELYKLSHSYLMGICLRYSRDRDSACEMMNAGFMKILSNLGAYKPDVPFKSWIRRIMINTLIDEYRRNRRERENITYVEEYFDSNGFADVNEALSRMNYATILTYIEQLPEATRKVFNLYAIDGFSHREIGELLGISEGTSKWHLNAARQKLKEQIGTNILTRV